MRAHDGDWLVVEPEHVGGARRRGLILQVRGAGGAPPYLVRWADSGHEGLVFPGPGARIERPQPHPVHTAGG